MTEENKTKKTVLYIVEDTETAQFRYRVKNVVETLEGSSKWTAQWVLKTDLDRVAIECVDLVVVLRQTAKDKKVLDFILRI